MDSQDLKREDFRGWIALSKENVDKYPDKAGVYVLLFEDKIQRLKLCSDVAKIGETKRGIRKRMSDFLNAKNKVNKAHATTPDKTQKRRTALRVGRILNEGFELKAAWKIISSEKNANAFKINCCRDTRNTTSNCRH